MKFEAANLHVIASQGTVFWLAYTLALYAGAVFLFRRSNKHPALNPTLLTIAGVAIALFSMDVEYARYFERFRAELSARHGGRRPCVRCIASCG
jgi:hypothetical protein